MLDGLADFLKGDTDGVTDQITKKMWRAAEDQDYEMAARYRDRLKDLERAIERQEMVSTKREDFDLIAFYGDDLETSVQVLYVRKGQGRRSTGVDRRSGRGSDRPPTDVERAPGSLRRGRASTGDPRLR